MSLLTLFFGALVGFSLGLTGGGGAIFAVPLLVYGLGVPAREAVGVSLLTVGSTALVGFVQRAWRGMVEFPTGLLFAVAGMIGAPLGSWLADKIPEAILLAMFALLMLFVALRMWLKARDSVARLPILADDNAGPTCRRDPEGKLRLTSQCAMLLGIVGLGAGVLSGMFGVGGGFIIVPALVMFSGMGMQRAIGTSLLVITLISASGTTSHLLAGKDLSLTTAGVFTGGSIAGLFAGSALAQRLAGPHLQKVFAAAIVIVAIYVIFRSVWH
ncbi:sulfite exporter TauE/SafE family protein [Anatilimnocola sp. NA78]|uniref:sulfite exporter TauE/SafE family protein n=1 Tax=Anatilimnocola sp. NA78 TaxID=3415683 RepID=UPI003CE59048